MTLTAFLSVSSFDPTYGGPAVSVSRLAKALADAGIQVGAWSPDQSALTSRLVAEHPLIIRLGGKLGDAVRAFGVPNIMHDNGIWLRHNHEIAKLSGKLGAARIVSVRGMLEPWAIGHKRLKKSLAWMVYQRGDLAKAQYLHATAESEAVNLHSYGLGVPICTVPNGVDIPEIADPDESRCGSTKAALYFGRIYPKKGLPMLIAAWARVRPPGWKLTIAGPDERGHQSEIERLVSENRLCESVEFVGAVSPDRKSAFYRKADLMILPTYSENFGMTVAESLAHGVPVLTTKGAPWAALIEHKCGWWVDILVDAIADGLRQATTCEINELRAMGERGRKFVCREFGWSVIADQLISTYEAALAGQESIARSLLT